MVIVTEDAEREHDCRDRANRREYEQIRPLDPTMQDWKIFRQRVGEDKHEKRQHAERENGNLPMRHIANLGLAFLRQPAGAEQRVAKAQADAAKNRKRGEPTDRTARKWLGR